MHLLWAALKVFIFISDHYFLTLIYNEIITTNLTMWA